MHRWRWPQANGRGQRPSLSPSSLRAWTPMMEGDYHGQRWTAWFLWKEGIQGSEIHRRMESVCGNEAPARRTVYRWLAKFSSGVETAAKGVSAGRPATSHTAANVAAVSGLIMANRRITFNEMQEETGLARGTLQAIVHDDLEMTKVCAQWVPHALTPQQKAQRVDICKELLALHDADPDDFFARLVTGDESWFLHDTPEKKRSSMEWKHALSPRPKKPRPALNTRKQLATVFWDVQGILLVDWLEPGRTINSDRYCEIARTLRRRIQQRRPGKWAGHVLLQHDNARPHTSRNTRDTLAALGFTVLPHPPYSPDLAPSDYALFDKMKDAVRGQHVPSSAELHAIVRRWCTNTPTEWFATALRDLPAKWQKCIDLAGDYI